jgi:hypothetical protein
MFLKDKLVTLRLKERKSLIQHIQTFRTILAQSTSVGITTSDEDAKLSLMRSMLRAIEYSSRHYEVIIPLPYKN